MLSDVFSKRLIIMQGLPGSGKTTEALHLIKEKGFQIIQRDCLRYIFGVSHNGEGWNEDIEAAVKRTFHRQLKALIHLGLDVVVDDTNTKFQRMWYYKDLAFKHDYHITVYRVDTPAYICKQRRKMQNFPMEVIDRQAENLEDWDRKFEEIYALNFRDVELIKVKR